MSQSVETPCFLIGERIGIRLFTEADLPELIKLEQSPAVLRYINGGQPLSLAEISARMHKLLAYYQESPGLGKFAVEDLQQRRFLGWVCLQPLDNTDEIEIGYRFHEATWGKGIATEASILLRDYYFDTLGRKRLVAVVSPQNLGSVRVIEKTGLQFIKQATYYNTTVKYYAMERD